ncbi:expressed unknown protein [Seminavis robusta]|uniref:Uncharacterized protein n=1 Tax=Seminavis robusta TaxID=568900 RepID=A0A9N8E7J8_9STRA|nr:expressed unknown protein [Seminavis robusta]|eukprot:Sro706_g190490.1 n/a (136) ;mRNA; f:42002-42409
MSTLSSLEKYSLFRGTLMLAISVVVPFVGPETFLKMLPNLGFPKELATASGATVSIAGSLMMRDLGLGVGHLLAAKLKNEVLSRSMALVHALEIVGILCYSPYAAMLSFSPFLALDAVAIFVLPGPDDAGKRKSK